MQRKNTDWHRMAPSIAYEKSIVQLIPADQPVNLRLGQDLKITEWVSSILWSAFIGELGDGYVNA